MATVPEALARAIEHHRSGRLQPAEAIYRRILDARPGHADALHLLGVVRHQRGDHRAAVSFIGRAIAARPDVAACHNNLASAHLALGDHEQAMHALRAAVRADPAFADAHHNLAQVLREFGRLDEALAHCDRALRIQPDLAEAMLTRASVLLARGQVDDAIGGFRRALSTRPDLVAGWFNLGAALEDLGRSEAAIDCYQRVLAARPQDPDASRRLGFIHQSHGRREEAATIYRRASRQPGGDWARYALATMLPVIYGSCAEVSAVRERFITNVTRLVESGIRLDPVRQRLPTPFYLAYQGRNDRDAQALVARVFADASHDLTRGRRRDRQDGRPIHVGFISSRFRMHTIGKLSLGLIEHLDRSRFTVTVLAIGAADDALARRIREAADRYVVLPANLALARRRVAAEALDVLFYTDIGMTSATYALAVSRLAPVQCVTWGHPVTTGLPTMDYFISSRLLEPEDAARHYTERLVLLDTLPVCYHRPRPARPLPSRAALGLPAGRRLYVCPQSLFKFHPDFDEALRAILRRDSGGDLLLIRGAHPDVTDRLQARFAAAMPDVADRIHFLPHQSQARFLGLLSAADVLLDTFHFGGGNSAYEAFAVGTPIVTRPAAFMRGRVTAACYRKMAVETCVAGDVASYVDRAVRLATDRELRRDTADRILDAGQVLFEDRGAVRELEAFFARAVSVKAPSADAA